MLFFAIKNIRCLSISQGVERNNFYKGVFSNTNVNIENHWIFSYIDRPVGAFSKSGRISRRDSSVYCPDSDICYTAWENGWASVPVAVLPAFGEGRRMPWVRPNPWRNFRGRTSIVVGAVLL